MTVKITKPEIKLREELNDLKKPTGVAGEAILRAETPQEQFDLIGAGRKNLIINGAMQVWQRGTSYTHDVTDGNAPAETWATVDRFRATGHTVGNSTAGEYTSTQEIYDGKIWLKSGCTTPYNGSSYIVRSTVHFIEAPNNVSPIQGKEVTLSYLFRAKQNGQYSVAVGDTTDANFTIFSFNYTGAGAAQKVSFTFTVPDVTPTNYSALRIYFSYGVPAGHSLISDESNLNGTFVSTSSMLTRASDYKWWEVAGDWVAFTEVQLELGNVATPFEHRSYAEELALCQRYYEVLKSNGTTGITSFEFIGTGNSRSRWFFKVEKRASPSFESHANWYNTPIIYSSPTDIAFYKNNYFYQHVAGYVSAGEVIASAHAEL